MAEHRQRATQQERPVIDDKLVRKDANDGNAMLFPEKEDFGNRAVYELVSDAAKAHPDDTCIYYKGRKLTYAEVDEASSRFAAALAEMGLEKGDRVAIVLPNIPQFVISYFGIMKAGGVVVPCNPIYTQRELEHQLRDSGASVVIGLNNVVTEKSKKDGHKVKKHNDFFSSVDGCIENVPTIKHVITTSLTDYLPVAKRKLAVFAGVKKVSRLGTVDFVDLVKSTAPATSFPAVNSRDDVAILQYTGGTTGVSKGAMLTHYNLYSNAAYTAKTFPLTNDDVSLCVIGLASERPYPSTRFPPVISMNFSLTAAGRLEPPAMHALTECRSNLLTFGLLIIAMYMAGTAQKRVTFSLSIAFITSSTWNLGRSTSFAPEYIAEFIVAVIP